MTQAASKVFWSKLDALRGQGEQPKPAEIASLALDSGLSATETLKEIERFTQFSRFDDREAFAAVADFIASLCGDSSNSDVLEFAALPGLMSASVFEDCGAAAGYVVTRNVELAEAYSVLFRRRADRELH